jgi:putative oxidoreductase
MKALRSLFMFLARLCIAAVFLWGGVGKWLYYDQTSAFMASKGIPMVPLALIVASLVEVIGALCLIFGYRTRFGATILLLFLIPATALFHDFWNLAGAEQSLQLIQFFKNLAIFGGLLYIICNGAGGLACDACRKHAKPVEGPPPPQPK